MKKRTPFFLLAVLLANSSPVFSQGLKKIPVSRSGCSLYTYCDMTFDESQSPDSSTVYAGECIKENVTYGIICVKLMNPSADINAAEELLTAYLDFLKGRFNIIKGAGYGKGHRLNKNENTRGILDYWEDNEKNNWKVKAWTDGKFIGVMYAFSKKEWPEQKVNIFLDGFRLPGN
ncbi:MAG: hypothetical protein FJY20_10260 [Bacteroidetes bacterium]|nr:hypothetical protein [Bacteroidota bacterium]